MKNIPLETLKPHVKNVLTGYGQRDPRVLQPLADYADWQTQAQLEIARRATRLLDSLHIEELTAVAQGEVDIAALAGEVAQSLEKQTD